LTRIVVEATGGYERRVAEACAAKELPLLIVQPMKVRQFARAEGVMAKTDKIDAQVIARFGKVLGLEPRPLPDVKVRKVRDLLANGFRSTPGRETHHLQHLWKSGDAG
jgi:transposase